MSWRNLITACLMLTMVVTSAAMAVARAHQPTVSGTMVLCTGMGPVSVQVDAEGQPIGPVQYCPDCAIGFFDPPPNQDIAAVVLVERLLQVDDAPALLITPQSIHWRPHARAPPSV